MRTAVLSLFAFLSLGAQPAPTVPVPDEIAQAVRQLGDDDFTVREKASDFLWKAGPEAGPALREAAKNTDAEVARRARSVLDRFARADFPGTPKPVVELIQRYWTVPQNERESVVWRICGHGSDGYDALARLLQALDDPTARRWLSQVMADRVVELVPTLQVRGKADEIERLLELGLENGVESAARDYAAWQALHGRASARARELRQRLGGSWSQAVVLLHLLAEEGQQAARAAERLTGTTLREQVYFLNGAWAELAKGPFDGLREIEGRGFRAAYHHLAGNHEELDRAVQELRRFAPAEPMERSWMTMEALLISERPAEAVTVLRDCADYRAAFLLLAQQLKYREAFQLAGQAGRGADRPFLELARAGTLADLGERDQARQVFAEYARDVNDVEDHAPRLYSLINAECRAGFVDDAFTHYARLPAKSLN